MIHGVLYASYGFYRLLPEAGQPVFQKRVQDFIKGRQFKSKTGEEITAEQKVLIAAPAIHLTWGFRKFFFPYFNLITVFSEGYADLSSKRYGGKGLQMTGAIVVSWPEWERATTTDFPMPFQPGLHEFALAMYEENVAHEEGYATIDPQWIEGQLTSDSSLAERLPDDWISAKEATGTEPQQWFATATEYFLADPATFYHKYPDWYTHLLEIYRWDPRTVSDPKTLNTKI